MADETQAPDPTQAPVGTPDDPIHVTIADQLPGGVVIPAEGLDVTVPGGRYIVGGQWVDAEGTPIKGKR